MRKPNMREAILAVHQKGCRDLAADLATVRVRRREKQHPVMSAPASRSVQEWPTTFSRALTVPQSCGRFRSGVPHAAKQVARMSSRDESQVEHARRTIQ